MMSREAGQKKETSINNNDREDIRFAYQVAIQMYTAECSNYWSSTSAFIQVSLSLIGASFLPKYIGLNDPIAYPVGLFLAILGLIASIIWLILNRRFERIVSYWILSARELEEKMSTHVSAIQRGKKLSEGQKVTVAKSKFGYSLIEKLTIGKGYVLVHFLFILIFITLIGLNWLKLKGAIR